MEVKQEELKPRQTWKQLVGIQEGSRLDPTARSNQVSKPLFLEEGTTSYGAGHGFVDNALLPKVIFRPCIPRHIKLLPSHSEPKGKGKAVVKDWFACSMPADQDATTVENAKYLQRLEDFSIAKAGISRSKHEIAQLTNEATKGSKFYEREREKDKQQNIDIALVLADIERKLEKRKGSLVQEEADVEHQLRQLEKERDTSQIIACVDADAFYASVEEIYNPSLIGKAFVVGRAIVLTASYEARKFGCRSAMGGNVAKRLCPDVIFVTPQFEKYALKSQQIMDVLKRYGDFAQASIDEAYINLTTYLANAEKTLDQVLLELREAVKLETGLSVSVGVSPNKLISKIAVDKIKPDGHLVVEPHREAMMTFMSDLPVRKVCGIGKYTQAWLNALGIEVVSDIWKQRGTLGLIKADLSDLLRTYLGIASNVVSSGKREERLSCGRGWTFEQTNDYQQFLVELRAMAEQLHSDLETAQISGRTITLEMKYDTFEVESRAFTAAQNTFYHTAEDLYAVGKNLLDKELEKRAKSLLAGRTVKGSYGVPKPVLRRMSLRLSHLRDDSVAARSKRGEDGRDMFDAWMLSADSGSKTVIDLTLEEDLQDSLCPICSRIFGNISVKALQQHVERCLDAVSGERGVAEAGPSGRPKKRRKKDAFDALMRSRK